MTPRPDTLPAAIIVHGVMYAWCEECGGYVDLVSHPDDADADHGPPRVESIQTCQDNIRRYGLTAVPRPRLRRTP